MNINYTAIKRMNNADVMYKNVGKTRVREYNVVLVHAYNTIITVHSENIIGNKISNKSKNINVPFKKN